MSVPTCVCVFMCICICIRLCAYLFLLAMCFCSTSFLPINNLPIKQSEMIFAFVLLSAEKNGG